MHYLVHLQIDYIPLYRALPWRCKYEFQLKTPLQLSHTNNRPQGVIIDFRRMAGELQRGEMPPNKK